MGSTKISQPSPPPQPSTADAVNAWVAAMPTVFAEQQRQAPLQAAQQVQLAQQYAPQLGAAAKAAQEALYPETAALQEQLAGQAGRGMEGGLTPEEEAYYRDILASNIGTNIGSPIGADYMSRNLLMARQQREDYFRNLGLSLAGRQPLATPSMPQTGQYAQNFTPGGVMNYMASTYAPYASAYSGMYNANAQMAMNRANMPFNIMKGVGSMAMGAGMMGFSPFGG